MIIGQNNLFVEEFGFQNAGDWLKFAFHFLIKDIEGLCYRDQILLLEHQFGKIDDVFS